MEHVLELNEMLLSVTLFALTITITVTCLRQDIKQVYGIAEDSRDNTTIVQNYSSDMLYETYEGVSKDLGEYYEGELLGANLIEEVKLLDKDVKVTVGNQLLNSLTYNSKDYLTYVRDYNDKPLRNIIIDQRIYLRTYTYDNDGNIAAVRYTLKQI